MVLADIIKRWKALKGEEALLCTGTDEHGLKVRLHMLGYRLRADSKAGTTSSRKGWNRTEAIL